ncbi:MAG TPA: ABC transporter ATP-binding protein [Syntrophales bacterium]|jgi:Fe-S cluster assembly ATP-binding protein|nr:ABC transporter ATP-binding protein [Syntrophales bacterium]HPX55023.1 ABC transporter ATP-binding protein [Syntrophales bacterium]HQA82837.1 ABC transporter ATP-binding protein [Syntrophales bacterium]
MLLEIRDLTIEVSNRTVLKNINIAIDYGETHILFGRNGSGKTSLLMAIMGFSGYKVKEGTILFKGEDITHAPIHERAKMGIGMSFQRPPTIRGLKTRDLIRTFHADDEIVEKIVEGLDFSSFLDRDVNLGFSGGEIKKSELLQLTVQNPDLILLDEPESGVDLENIKIIGRGIKRLLQKNLRRQRVKSGLVITHTGLILNYLEADNGYLMLDGTIRCEGNPREMFETIQSTGYEECARCQR